MEGRIDNKEDSLFLPFPNTGSRARVRGRRNRRSGRRGNERRGVGCVKFIRETVRGMGATCEQEDG